jgi:hypothetical protein
MTFAEALVNRDEHGRFAEAVGSPPEVDIDPFSDLFVKYDALHSELAAKHEAIEGRTRTVYLLDDNRVAKVPTDEDGLNANYREALWSEKFGKTGEVPIADAAIETWTSADGTELDVLVMERVEETAVVYKDMPEWVGWVDCGQVGYDREGRLVAYDL